MEQGLCQGRVLAPLLFNILFVVVIKVVYTYFKVDKDIDALVKIRRNAGAVGASGCNHWRTSPGDVALRHAVR